MCLLSKKGQRGGSPFLANAEANISLSCLQCKTRFNWIYWDLLNPRHTDFWVRAYEWGDNIFLLFYLKFLFISIYLSLLVFFSPLSRIMSVLLLFCYFLREWGHRFYWLNELGYQRSIPGRVITKTQKMVLDGA